MTDAKDDAGRIFSSSPTRLITQVMSGARLPSDGFGLLWGRQRRTGRTEKARVAVAAR